MRGNVIEFPRPFARAFVLAAAASLPAPAASAQVVGLAEFGGERDKPRGRLELKLSAPVTTALCRGDSLLLEVEVRNAGRAPFEFDQSELWKRFTYAYESPEGGGPGGGMGISCNCPAEPLTLVPGRTLWDRHEFSLKNEFFNQPGRYEISVSVEQVSSNRLKFEIMDCGHPAPEEK